MDCDIREAQVSDAGQIARIGVESWRAAYRGIIPDTILDALDVSEREKRWTENILDPGQTVLLAKLDRVACGYCNFQRARDVDITPTSGEVTAIYVAQEHWGLGPGQALIEAALLALSQAGFSTASVWVLEENARARRFYEKNGFGADGSVATSSDELALRSIRYQKQLESQQ